MPILRWLLAGSAMFCQPGISRAQAADEKPASGAHTYRNPLMPEREIADPEVIRVNGTYSIYHEKWDAGRNFHRFLALDPLWFDDQGELHAKVSRGTDEPAP